MISNNCAILQIITMPSLSLQQPHCRTNIAFIIIILYSRGLLVLFILEEHVHEHAFLIDVHVPCNPIAPSSLISSSNHCDVDH